MKKLESTSMKTKNNPASSFLFLREEEFLENSPHPKIQFISHKQIQTASRDELEKRFIELMSDDWVLYKIFNNFCDAALKKYSEKFSQHA